MNGDRAYSTNISLLLKFDVSKYSQTTCIREMLSSLINVFNKLLVTKIILKRKKILYF
jgi:hypothetical protein